MHKDFPVIGPFPIERDRLISYAKEHESGAKRVTYSCGHTFTFGGNLADPSCILAEVAGILKVETSEDDCGECDKVEKLI